MKYQMFHVKLYLLLNDTNTQAMIIGSRTRLKRLIDPRPVVVYGMSVTFVKQYSYLGIK